MTRRSRGRLVVTFAGGLAGTVATATAGYAAVPGEGIVKDAVGAATGWAFDKVATGIANWVLGAVAFFVEGVVNFLGTAARPDVSAPWFAGPGSPFAAVRGIAVALLVGFLLLATLQGLLHGDVGGMLRRLAIDLPLAILGMVAVVAVSARLLDLTDAMSSAVLGHADGQALSFLARFGAVAMAATQGFAAVVVGLVAVVAGLMLWVELLIRSALIYVLVAISPLSFAAMVWPAARGALRRTVEILVAVILSKFVICVALAVGAAALGGGTLPASSGGGNAAAGVGALVVGTALLAMAAFSPFLVVKLVPIAEAALVAQGISRGPLRATHSTMGTYYYASSIGRLAGRRSTPGGGGLGGAPNGGNGPGTGGPQGPSGGPGKPPSGGGSGNGGVAAGAGSVPVAATAVTVGASAASRAVGRAARVPSDATSAVTGDTGASASAIRSDPARPEPDLAGGRA